MTDRPFHRLRTSVHGNHCDWRLRGAVYLSRDIYVVFFFFFFENGKMLAGVGPFLCNQRWRVLTIKEVLIDWVGVGVADPVLS